jgi:hypothetical protein
VPDHTQDPARFSDETLRSFETDLPEPESHDEPPATPPLRRQGALILVGMVAVIAVGVIAVLAWLL